MKTESNEKWIVCRVCLNNPSDGEELLHEIFSQTASTRLDQMLHICAGIPVSLDDKFPDKMCSKCVRCLRLSYKFRQTCQRSHQHILDMLMREASNSGNSGEAEQLGLSDDLTVESVVKIWEQDTSQLDGDFKVEKEDFQPSQEEFITYVVEEADGGDTIVFDEEDHTQAAFDVEHTLIEKAEPYAVYEEYELLSTENQATLSDPGQETRSNVTDLATEVLPDVDITEDLLSSDESYVEEPRVTPGNRQRTIRKLAAVNKKDIEVEPAKKQGKKQRNKLSTYICDVCGNIYPSQARLTEHIKIHSGVKPHECEICGRGFVQNQQLVRHMNTHTGNRPYKCNYCPAAFADRSTKTKHHRIHTKERPYECDVCSRTFTYSDNLKFHKMIHTGEKPHVCDLCGKGFVKAYKMRLHRVTHEKRGSCSWKPDVEISAEGEVKEEPTKYK
ncbi:zinc finger and SCAN domain-containing protein 31 [Drosophila ficusphila]|uniref:zinc finger and SCAN domain-containing protein 31 n=1 Tax=Drosophila ficusphila TaxID=30025 RepID=UPI001C8A3CA0|nr:zinc finger and SCAN domain-containing protein 31 [Drosophila ficusphila]